MRPFVGDRFIVRLASHTLNITLVLVLTPGDAQGFPDDNVDPVFRKDGEDQAFLNAITTFFELAPVPDHASDAPLVSYM